MSGKTKGVHGPTSAHQVSGQIRRGGVLTWPAALLATFAAYTWLVIGWSPLVQVDEDLNRNFHVRTWWPVLHVLDRIGQRAVCLPVLAAVIALAGWRHRSWRPVLLGVGGVVGVTLLVLIAKLTLARGAPLSGESFFSGGDLYPSGHTANVALVYGLSYYLATRYLIVTGATRRVLLATLGLVGVVMFGTSLLLRWHWFSDLVAGFLIGGAVLALTISLDIALSRQPRSVVGAPQRPVQEPEPSPAASGSKPSRPIRW